MDTVDIFSFSRTVSYKIIGKFTLTGLTIVLKLIFVLIVTDYGRRAESFPAEKQLRLP